MNFAALYALDPDRGEEELARLAAGLDEESPWREALRLTRFGVSVLPLYGITGEDGDLHCECGRRACKEGKHPRAVEVEEGGRRKRSWLPLVTSNPRQVADYGRRFPRANFGVATGKPSRMVVIDLDGDDGAASFAQAEEELGPVPLTATARSGRDGPGSHIYLRLPEGGPVPGANARLGRAIDIRGAGGLAVGPGSRHKSGRRYAWTLAPEDVGFAEIPPAWLERLTGAVEPQTRPRASGIARVSRNPSEAGSGASNSRGMFGDGEGLEGFHKPIWFWLIRYFGNKPNGDYETIFRLLRELIDAAPKKDRSSVEIARYKSESYLEERATRAQAYIMSQY